MPIPDAALCDCHAHIFGDPAQFPVAPGADYTPPSAAAEAYRQQLDALGVKRCVLVQPSVYATDNRCLLDALQQLGSEARGVAVIDSGTPLDELRAMHARGVRGIRLNTLAANGPRLDELESFERCIAELPWHLQVLLQPRTLLDAVAHLERVACPLVLDHFASFTPDTSARELDALFDLAARKNNLWIKLSAPYLFSDCSTAALDRYRYFTERAVEVMPQRLLWATDWPHTARGDKPIATEDLHPLLANWVNDAALLQRISVDNPATLYGF